MANDKLKRYITSKEFHELKRAFLEYCQKKYPGKKLNTNRDSFLDLEDDINVFADEHRLSRITNSTLARLYNFNPENWESQRFHTSYLNTIYLFFENQQTNHESASEAPIDSTAGIKGRYTLVDQLVQEWHSLKAARENAETYFLNETVGPDCSFTAILKVAASDERLVLEAVINFYAKVSRYYQNGRIDTSYLCLKDRLKIKYWFHKYFEPSFKSEKGHPDRHDILKLSSIVVKIDELKKQKESIPARLFADDFTTYSRKDLLTQIKWLDDHIDFRWDKTESFFVMAHYRRMIADLLHQSEKQGINDYVYDYSLREKLSSYIHLIGFQQDGHELIDRNFNILRNIFPPGTDAYYEEERNFCHSRTTYKTHNAEEVDYTKATWGPRSIQYFEALCCQVCLKIKFHLFEQAHELMEECEGILASPGFEPGKIPRRNYHVDMNYGKIYYYEALAHGNKSNIFQELLHGSIGHFLKAVDNYTDASDGLTNLTKHYVYYYLYRCFKMAGDLKMVEHYFNLFAPFFRFHPISTMCHVDKEELNDEIKQYS